MQKNTPVKRLDACCLRTQELLPSIWARLYYYNFGGAKYENNLWKIFQLDGFQL